jgi:hypothetical protein
MTEEDYEAAEARWLNLVSDFQSELAQALNSMGGMPIPNAAIKYVAFAGKHANQAIDSYVLLRQTRRIAGSKLLVRLAIETTLRFLAVHKKPALVYRVIFGERKSRLLWLRANAQRLGMTFDAQDEEKDWQAFKKHCIEEIPGVDLQDVELSIEAIARDAGGHAFYDSHYRLYSSFTHANFEATTGQLDWLTNLTDNRAISACALELLKALSSMGAATPNLSSLESRYAKLHTQLKPDC